MARQSTPLRLCACGCGNRVKFRRCRYASHACVPKSLRAENCRRGRATYAYRCRMRIFNAEVAALNGRSVTREDLLAVFMRIYTRAYNSGFRTGQRGGIPALPKAS